jgi:hypothetical protein
MLEIIEWDDFGAPNSSRSLLLAGMEAPWNGGAPSPDPRCRLCAWVSTLPGFLLRTGGDGAVYVIFLPEGAVEACLHRSGYRGRFWDENPCVLL